MLLSHFSRVIWRFIKPEVEEVILYIFCIFGLAAIAFYQAVIKGTASTGQNLSASMNIIHNQLTFITSGNDSVAKLFTFGTWFVIGTVVYMIAWFLISFASGAFKDIEVSNNYVHPRSFNKSTFWGSILARVALQISAAISFTIYISIWISVFAPAWLSDFREIFAVSISSESLVSLLIAIIGIVFTLHIGAIIFRVMLLRSKYFYQR